MTWKLFRMLRGISVEDLKDVARFNELDHDNLKAEVRIFCQLSRANLAEEIDKKFLVR